MIEEIPRGFLFPRIPLSFTLPDSYPDVECISNISVIPKIRNFRLGRDEMEISGSYETTVSYFKVPTGSGNEVRENRYNPKELYTASFSRPFHTFVDLESINSSKPFRPLIVVDRIDLEPAKGRGFKGELVLELINRGRRKSQI